MIVIACMIVIVRCHSVITHGSTLFYMGEGIVRVLPHKYQHSFAVTFHTRLNYKVSTSLHLVGPQPSSRFLGQLPGAIPSRLRVSCCLAFGGSGRAPFVLVT